MVLHQLKHYLFLTILLLTIFPFPVLADTFLFDDNRSLRIAVLKDNYPYSFSGENGEARGSLVDFWTLAAAKKGTKVQFVFGSLEENIIALKSDKADILGGISTSLELDQFFLSNNPLEFSIPMARGTLASLSQKNPKTNSLNDTIGILQSTTYCLNELTFIYPSSKFAEYHNDDSLISAFENGEIPSILAPLDQLHIKAPPNFFTDNTIELDKVMQFTWRAASLKNKYSFDMIGSVNSIINLISPAELQAIIGRWAGETSETGEQFFLNTRERKWLKDHPTIRVGSQSDKPPYSQLNEYGLYEGIAADYLKLISEKVGVHFKISESKPFAQKGLQTETLAYDIISNITRNNDRNEVLTFTKSYTNSPLVLITKSEADPITSLKNITSQRVSVLKGTNSHLLLTNEFPNIEILIAETKEEAFENLSDDSTDAFLGNLASVSYFMKNRNVRNMKVAATTSNINYFRFGIRKDWTIFKDIMNKALLSISDEERREIESRWLNSQPTTIVDWSYIIRITTITTLIALSIIIIIVLWNRRLRKEIANRKIAEDKARATEQTLIGMSDVIHDAFILVDELGKISFWNNTASKLFGHSQDEASNQLIHELISIKDDNGDRINSAEQLLNVPKDTAIQKTAILHNHSEVPIEFFISPLSMDDSNFYVIMIRDISERRKEEEQLKLTQYVLDTASQHIFWVEAKKEGNISYCNSIATVDFGYSKNEILKSTIFDLINFELDSIVKLKKQLDTGGCLYTTKKAKCKNGRTFPIDVMLSRHTDDQNDLFIIFCKDISTQVLAEKKLKAQVKDLDSAQSAMKKVLYDLEKQKQNALSADKSKSRFLANMSHEIRTPMNAIIGMNHLLRQTVLTEKQHEYVESTYSASVNLLRIINDILDFSKIEAGKMSIEKVPFHLSEVLKDLAVLVSEKAQQKDIELIFNIGIDVPKIIIGDSLRLCQILINFVTNAIKFTETGEVIVKITTRQINEKEAHLDFSITDTGCGMTKEALQNLFKPFNQADISTTRKYGGTGLGLAICRNIVKLMGGQISVKSKVDVGSIFAFDAKFKLSQDKLKKQTPLTIEEKTNCRILLVDDNKTCLNVTNEYLKSFDFNHIDIAQNGKQACLKIAEQAALGKFYNLVMIDWIMPQMDGITAIRQVRKFLQIKYPAAPLPHFIIITGYMDNHFSNLVEKNQIDHVLLKPITPSSLFDKIINVLHDNVTLFKPTSDNSIENHPVKSLVGINILLVEDNVINQQVACEILETEGATITIANNGQEGVDEVIKMSKENPYQLVLMDLQMPVMDGYEATKKIIEIQGDDTLPILAMTADAMLGVKEKTLQWGMVDYIEKPINVNTLIASIKKHANNIAINQVPRKNIKHIKKDIKVNGKEELHLDLKSALDAMGGNKQLMGKILQKFHNEQNKSILETIENYKKEHDKEEILRLLHTIKGLAGTIGANKLKSSSESLSIEITNDSSTINESILQFKSNLSIVISEISKLLPREKKTDTAVKTLGSNADFITMLEKLHIAVSSQRPKPSKEILNEILAFSWPETEQQLANELDTLIPKYRFKSAKEKIEQFMKEFS